MRVNNLGTIGPCKICGDSGTPVLLHGKAEFICNHCGRLIIDGSLCYIPELDVIIEEVTDGPSHRKAG
jgi:hypothetical protein